MPSDRNFKRDCIAKRHVRPDYLRKWRDIVLRQSAVRTTSLTLASRVLVSLRPIRKTDTAVIIQLSSGLVVEQIAYPAAASASESDLAQSDSLAPRQPQATVFPTEFDAGADVVNE